MRRTRVLHVPGSINRRGVVPGPPTLEPVMDRLAFGFLWAFILVVPWEGATLIGGLAITVWLGLMAVAAAVVRLFLKGSLRKPSVLHGWMAAFVVWASLSLAWSRDTDMTLSRTGSYLQLAIMVWLIWELVRTEERWRSLLYAYCLGASVSSINAIHNLVMGMTSASEDAEKLAEYGRYAPAGFDQNEFALTLALSLPMAFYLLTRRQSFLAAMVCWAQLLLGVVAILLTGSRAGLISLSVALTITPFALPLFRGWKRRICWLAIPCIVVSALFVVPANTWERLLTTGSEISGGTLTYRRIIWAAGVNVFRQHPFLGVGAGAFASSVESAIDIHYVAHNSFLSVLVELGVVGELILLALLSSMLYLAVRMGGLDRWLWIVLLLTWAAGVSSLTWEYRKVTWFLFGMIAAEAGLMRTGRRPAATAIAQSVFAARAHSGPLPAQSGAQMIQDIQTLPRLRRFV
ncbi:MAG TPA: O-antigen ligase family protein [Candidatus Acidoferrales bacterium]|nr:O-antigen ligase family protein [Candidatus Acidoferrales bacterium]